MEWKNSDLMLWQLLFTIGQCRLMKEMVGYWFFFPFFCLFACVCLIGLQLQQLQMVKWFFILRCLELVLHPSWCWRNTKEKKNAIKDTANIRDISTVERRKHQKHLCKTNLSEWLLCIAFLLFHDVCVLVTTLSFKYRYLFANRSHLVFSCLYFSTEEQSEKSNMNTSLTATDAVLSGRRAACLCQKGSTSWMTAQQQQAPWSAFVHSLVV